MLCPFDAFTNIALNVTRNVENKHTLFITTLAAFCGAPRSKEVVYVTFESMTTFLNWLGVSINIKVAACQRNVQRRKNNTMVRMVGDRQRNNLDRILPLNLFIVHTFRQVAAKDNKSLDIERGKVLEASSSVWNTQNVSFVQPLTGRCRWTSFHSMTEETIFK